MWIIKFHPDGGKTVTYYTEYYSAEKSIFLIIVCISILAVLTYLRIPAWIVFLLILLSFAIVVAFCIAESFLQTAVERSELSRPVPDGDGLLFVWGIPETVFISVYRIDRVISGRRFALVKGRLTWSRKRRNGSFVVTTHSWLVIPAFILRAAAEYGMADLVLKRGGRAETKN